MNDDKYHELLDKELERLHKLIEDGKEVHWATEMLTGILTDNFRIRYISSHSNISGIET